MNTIKLIIDTPFRNPDLIYSTNYYCLDPFVFLEYNGRKIIWVPATEYEQAKKKAAVDEVYNLTDAMVRVREQNTYSFLLSSVIIDRLREHDIKSIFVPATFPLIEADNLRKYNFTIEAINGSFFSERVTKSEEEIASVDEVSRKNVAVMNEVHEILRLSSITNENKIKYNDIILTSEYLQNYILKSFIDKGLFADSVIVAGGDQGCDPHENGHGFLYANQSIIVDIFPRDRNTFYYSDMTRTFCKGKASDELKKMYAAVKEAQDFGLDNIHAGVDGKKLHMKIQDIFVNKGFKSGMIDGVLQGFFHGTGHGLGLDCHEYPYISNSGTELPENSIVSVEPGLYYPGIGAVRIEDLVLVKNDGIYNFITCVKQLEVE